MILEGRNGRGADADRPGGHRDRGGSWARPGGGAGAGPGRGTAGAQRPAGGRGPGGGFGHRRGRRAGGGGRRGCRGVGDGRAAGGDGAGAVRAAGHPGQQRRGAARPDDLLDVRPGVGPGHPGPPARALRDHALRHRLLAPASKAAGQPVYARIVNTSSEAFLLGSAGQPNYAAAKAGIAALTVTTARSCARYGVRANAICPRARTAMTAGLMGPPPVDGVDPLAPEHVAPLVVYLASPAAETINGEVFVVHGGVAAVMDPPRIRTAFHASGTPDGMWTLEAVHAALSPAFGAAAPAVGFGCEDTLTLATETIRFPAGGTTR